MRSVPWSPAKCLQEGRTVFEISPRPGRAILMPEMCQKSQILRHIHDAKINRLLFEISFCGACVEYQRTAMDTDRYSAAVSCES